MRHIIICCLLSTIIIVSLFSDESIIRKNKIELTSLIKKVNDGIDLEDKKVINDKTFETVFHHFWQRSVKIILKYNSNLSSKEQYVLTNTLFQTEIKSKTLTPKQIQKIEKILNKIMKRATKNERTRIYLTWKYLKDDLNDNDAKMIALIIKSDMNTSKKRTYDLIIYKKLRSQIHFTAGRLISFYLENEDGFVWIDFMKKGLNKSLNKIDVQKAKKVLQKLKRKLKSNKNSTRFLELYYQYLFSTKI